MVDVEMRLQTTLFLAKPLEVEQLREIMALKLLGV